MDAEEVLLVIVALILVAIIIYLLMKMCNISINIPGISNIIPSAIPTSTPVPQTPTPTAIPTPSYGQVIVYYSGGSLILPQQGGATITVPQNSELTIYGTVNPNTTVFFAIFNMPQGQPVYTNKVQTNGAGLFEIVVPLSNLTPGQKYLADLNPCYGLTSCPFPNNYYFYINVSSS